MARPAAAAGALLAASTGLGFRWWLQVQCEGGRFNFPESQLFRPAIPYPEWDDNWDHRGAQRLDKGAPATTRHILLVRHGQYVEEGDDDAAHVLTPLGRAQAAATGRRLRDILCASQSRSARLHCSTMARAKETAAIIDSELRDGAHDGACLVEALPPQESLEEGQPAHVLPLRTVAFREERVHQDSARIESAFRSLFHRAPPLAATGDAATEPGTAATATAAAPRHSHEWDIVVCHGNVIRYMAMRALQLPPEAWLRLSTFNCSITYLVIRPNGRVSMRLLGDVGHLPMDATTFSGHHGYEW